MSHKQIIREGISEYKYNESKRHVRIKYYNNPTGRAVLESIKYLRSSLCGGYEIKKYRERPDFYRFDVVFYVRDGARTFYNNLKKIMNEQETYIPQSSEDRDVTEGSTVLGDTNKANLLITVAGLILLLAIVIWVWKRNK